MVKCQNEKCPNEATIICKECGVVMCEVCSSIVHAYEHDHNPMKYNPQSDAIAPICPKHKQPADMYLTNKGIVVCSKCLLEEYKGEPYKSHTEVGEEKKAQLGAHKQSLENVQNELVNNLESLKDLKTEEENNKNESIKQLDEWKNTMFGLINKIHQEATLSITDYHGKVNNDLTEKIKSVTGLISELDKRIKSVEERINYWNNDNLINNLQKLKPTLDEGNKLIKEGENANENASDTEKRLTFFKTNTNENDIRRTIIIDFNETPRNVPRVKIIKQINSYCTKVNIAWEPIQKIPEKLVNEPLKYSVALFNNNNSETVNPIKIVDVGTATNFTVSDLIPATTYKVSVMTSFGNDPKKVSKSAFININTLDTLDKPSKISIVPHTRSVDISLQPPQCLENRVDLLEEVIYIVSIVKKGSLESPINKMLKNTLNLSFDNLEIQTSYKCIIKCKFGDNGKESIAEEVEFTTAEIVQSEYFSKFVPHKSISVDPSGYKFKVVGKEGFGVLKDSIGKDKSLVATFSFRKGSTPTIGFIPESELSNFAAINGDSDVLDKTIYFSFFGQKILFRGTDIIDSVSHKTFDNKNDYKLSIGFDTSTHKVTVYYNYELISEGSLKTFDLSLYEKLHPYTILSFDEEVEIVSSVRPQQKNPVQTLSGSLSQQQQQQLPPPSKSSSQSYLVQQQQQQQITYSPSSQQQQQQQQKVYSPTQQNNTITYKGNWRKNAYFNPLNADFSAIQKVGGEDLYGAIIFGDRGFERGFRHCFKVAIGTPDRRVRIGVAHRSEISMDMNSSALFVKRGVIFADLSQNKIVVGGKEIPFSAAIPSNPNGPFYLDMTIMETGEIIFHYKENGFIAIGAVNPGWDLNDFYPFVALSGNNAVKLEKN